MSMPNKLQLMPITTQLELTDSMTAGTIADQQVMFRAFIDENPTLKVLHFFQNLEVSNASKVTDIFPKLIFKSIYPFAVDLKEGLYTDLRYDGSVQKFTEADLTTWHLN